MKLDDVACRQVVEMLTDYLDGVLPMEDRAALEQHLVLCEECTTFLEQLRTTIGLTGVLREEDVPDQVMAAVMQVIKEEPA